MPSPKLVPLELTDDERLTLTDPGFVFALHPLQFFDRVVIELIVCWLVVVAAEQDQILVAVVIRQVGVPGTTSSLSDDVRFLAYDRWLIRVGAFGDEEHAAL